MWLPEITANGVLAFSTLVYGGATTALVWSSRADRRQRDKHFLDEQKDRKLESLYGAFCDAWGYYNGLHQRSGDSRVSASDAGRITEALIRLEAQLRLNGHEALANDLEYAVLNFDHIETQLPKIGRALGLMRSGAKKE